MKLTNAQLDVLEWCGLYGDFSCAENYKPAQKLVGLGLVSPKIGKFGSYKVEITPAGRSALEEQP